MGNVKSSVAGVVAAATGTGLHAATNGSLAKLALAGDGKVVVLAVGNVGIAVSRTVMEAGLGRVAEGAAASGTTTTPGSRAVPSGGVGGAGEAAAAPAGPPQCRIVCVLPQAAATGVEAPSVYTSRGSGLEWLIDPAQSRVPVVSLVVRAVSQTESHTRTLTHTH